MAFLSILPRDLVPGMCLMMLHTEMAEISAEWGGKTGKKGQLDLFIKIPFLNDSGKCFIIAVENKIEATQGVNQLSDYSELLSNFNKGDVHIIGKYYLTAQEEEPRDTTWSAITYADTVIPAITQVLDSKKDKISDYIRYVLKDYLHLMDETGEDDVEIESLAQKFSHEQIRQIQLSRTVNGVQNSVRALEPPWKNLWVKYPKACEWLADYDTDPRTAVVNYLTSLKSFKLPDSNLIFNVETTRKTYARFSILLPKNASCLIEISKPPSKKWLDSYQNLAFEIGIRPVGKNEENSGASEDPIEYYIWATFILGPNTLDRDQRLILVNDIRSAFREAALVDCSLFYTRLIRPRRLSPKGVETLSGDGLLQWVKDNILTAENGDVKFNQSVLEIAAQANVGLSKFFDRPENASQLLM